MNLSGSYPPKRTPCPGSKGTTHLFRLIQGAASNRPVIVCQPTLKRERRSKGEMDKGRDGQITGKGVERKDTSQPTKRKK